MEVLFKVHNGVTFKIVGDSDQILWEQLGHISEIFGAQPGGCGACNSQNIRYGFRQVADKKQATKIYKYYELVCNDCSATFKMGQRADGTGLFPKHEEGWNVYRSGGDDEDFR